MRWSRLARLDYGWVNVGVLAVTETVSYGVLMYAFPVLLAPMQATLGWSQATLTGAFSLAALTAGICAIPVGRCIDRFGARGIMTAGSLFATLLVLAWSRVTGALAYYVIWAGLGACMAAVFYEPAFALLARWFRRRRGRALTIITLAGALAGTIFVPLTTSLVGAIGWRDTAVWLAAILGAFTILPHALLLRNAPADSALTAPDIIGSRPTRHDATPFHPKRETTFARFPFLAGSVFLVSLVNFAIAVHLVPLLIARGNSPVFAAAAMAVLGLAKVPGRILFAFVSTRVSSASANVAIFAIQALALVAFITLPDAIGVWTFVALFGAGDGASTPARADLVGEHFRAAEYGRVSGELAFIAASARAVAPFGVSLTAAAFGGYTVTLWLLAGAMTGAALTLRASFSHHLRPPVRKQDKQPAPEVTIMSTATKTSSQDLLEQTRRILSQSVQNTGNARSSQGVTETPAASCCSTAKQDVCCEASEKASCCGAEPVAASGCGCQ
jgi:MFS family permease